MLELLISALAAYRIARMISSERGAFDCFNKFRDLVESLLPEGHWMRYGITCPLCIGFWLSFVFVALPDWVVVPFAVAGLQTMLQKLDWYIKYHNQVLWEMRDSYKYRMELSKRFDKASNDVSELLDVDAAKQYDEASTDIAELLDVDAAKRYIEQYEKGLKDSELWRD